MEGFQTDVKLNIDTTMQLQRSGGYDQISAGDPQPSGQSEREGKNISHSNFQFPSSPKP